MKRLSNQEVAAAKIIVRDAQRKENAREWVKRAVEAHDMGDYDFATRLFNQSLLEWPFPNLHKR